MTAESGAPARTRRQVEPELARYYQAESPRRRGRPVPGRRVAARERALQGILTGVAGGVLLDLGSGPGADTGPLRAAGHQVLAVDLAPANALAAGPPALVASAVELPLATGTVGGVWSMSALMHVPDDAIATALRELARVVAPGGPLVLGTWGGPDRQDRQLDDELGLTRTFTRRSDRRWRALLEQELGEVQRYESWTDVSIEGWDYQWAELTVGA